MTSNPSFQPAHTTPVDLAERSYDIHIGPDLLRHAGHVLKTLSAGARALIISDSHVFEHHGHTLVQSLEDDAIAYETHVVTPGEPSKSWQPLQEIVDKALSMRLERGDVIIAFGGGVIGDLAGFAAAITLRGVRLIQIPTSLLAQVDSSVGGKTGINARQGKNLIGAFYQPLAVLADTHVLDTLPAREFRAGFAEVIKYGLINDAAFFTWLETHRHAIFEGGSQRAEAIARCCRAKANIVAEDEREKGRRALLNLGHTFGHALEGLCHYDGSKLVHGEGVALGMVMAFAFSQEMGLASKDDLARIITLLKASGLPVHPSEHLSEAVTAEQMMHFMLQDKKVSKGSLTLILARGIGHSFIARDVDQGKVSDFLTRFLAHHTAV
jgi:3-dehydroquinate synthase